MAVKVVHVSDISGKEADESLGRLVVHEHPEYADLPGDPGGPPEEVETLQGASRFVTVEWIAPGARKGERMVVSLDDFNLLAGAVMESAVQDALIAKHRNRSPSRRRVGVGRPLGPGQGQLRHPRARRRAPPRPHHRGREGARPQEPGPGQPAPPRRRPARDRP